MHPPFIGVCDTYILDNCQLGPQFGWGGGAKSLNIGLILTPPPVLWIFHSFKNSNDVDRRYNTLSTLLVICFIVCIFGIIWRCADLLSKAPNPWTNLFVHGFGSTSATQHFRISLEIYANAKKKRNDFLIRYSFFWVFKLQRTRS